MKVQIFNKFLVTAMVFAVCLIAVSQTDAQKKRRSKTRVPQPVATPSPVASSSLIIPEIIRRADENDIETPTLTSDETQTTETPENAENLRIRINELNAKLKSVEAGNKKDADAMEKKLLLNLDILTKAEQRTESLRKQLYELVEKENAVKSKVEQITYDMRPEMIDRNVAFAGSLRPEDVRDARQKSLQSEKTNLENLLAQLTANREKLEISVQRADLLVEKIRLKFEKEIDDALIDETQPQN